MDNVKRDRIAQWAFDTRSILGRFHLWLEDVDEEWLKTGPDRHETPGDSTVGHSFVGEELEKSFIMAAAVTALGTRLFGRCGEGKAKEKAEVNRIKKDADAASAYALSEALWYLSRRLPENHALLVSIGEGLMPKAGETPEQGSNPLLGFGRVYARPQVARKLDHFVRRLINEKEYRWENFWADLQRSGLTVWGAAIDTLENTSRFAEGAPTGPLTVLHLYDQPLIVCQPYEGYMGTLTLPRDVHETAALKSVLLTYRTPRAIVLDMIQKTYPEIKADNVHVWTLTGSAREARLGSLWNQWRNLGVHLVQDGWPLPTGAKAFTSSGTYAPTFSVGPYRNGSGQLHLFICDGYAASAEAVQAASLDPIVNTRTSMAVFSSKFKTSWDHELDVMRLNPDAGDFRRKLDEALGTESDEAIANAYRRDILHAREANIPLRNPSVAIDDFFPLKRWNVLAVAGYMLPDPYSNSDGVEEVGPKIYRVVTSASTRHGILRVTLKLRLLESVENSRLVFSPLLDRFYYGENYKSRPVKISDSGRIRNELQTLCSEALEFAGDEGICVVFDRIEEAVLPRDKQQLIRNVLTWYKEAHPIWFHWLSMR